MTREVEQVAGVDYENGSIESYLVRGNDPACDVIGIRKTKEGARDWTREMTLDEAIMMTHVLAAAVALYCKDKVGKLRGIEELARVDAITLPDDHEVPLYSSAESFTEGNS